MTDSTWFTDAQDARTYLEEVGRLWSAWAIGLILLLSLGGGWRLLAGVVLIAIMVWLAIPIQRRAQSIVGPDAGRHSREATLRELAYGEAPLRAALGMVGTSPAWLWVRRALVVATILGFVFVVVAIVRA